LVYLVGADVGTSATKVLMVDELGNLVAKASHEYPISSPRPNYAEQDPEWWWNAVKTSIKEALSSSRVDGSRISAVGLTGQMHGTVLLRKDGKPLRPAIIWSDKRSSAQCTEFYQKIGREKVVDIVCNPVVNGFMGPSLLWVRENEPSIFNQISKVLSPKDYVRFKLTGSYATDTSDASATLLFDVKRREWSQYLLSQLGFSHELFVEVFESTEVTGKVSAEASEATGLPQGIPVVAGGGDSPVGAVGCGAIKRGVVSSNIGTGGQIFVTSEEFKVEPENRIHTFCHAVPGKWYLQGAILSAGLSLRWFRDNLAQLEKSVGAERNVDPYDLLSKEAESAEPGCRGLIFLPYLLGERSPHMDPNAKGVFFGLTFEHGRSHLIRAIMEGVAYALRDCLEIFKGLGIKTERVIARGGGSRSPLWRQIQADVFNTEVARTEIEECAAFGAALLAGIGVSVYRNFEDACEKGIRLVSSQSPSEERVKVYDEYYTKVYRNLYPALRNCWPEVEKTRRY
jgi:xylulokinase